jgi:hypothetical protein
MLSPLLGEGGYKMLKKYLAIFVILLLGFFITKAMAETKPVVYYTFDELTVKDVSGNGNDGTIKNNVKLSDNGKLGKCYQFDGVNSYVELNRVVQDNFTLMVWIKTDKPGLAGTQAYQGSAMIWSDVGGTANDFVFALLEKKLSFFCGNPDTSVNSDNDVVTGDWVHIAAVRDLGAGEIAIYINGKKDKSVAHGNKNPLNALPTIAIGGNVLDNRYYTGLMDEVKIFDAALTEQEIQKASSSLAAVDSRSKLAVTWGTLKLDF